MSRGSGCSLTQLIGCQTPDLTSLLLLPSDVLVSSNFGTDLGQCQRHGLGILSSSCNTLYGVTGLLWLLLTVFLEALRIRGKLLTSLQLRDDDLCDFRYGSGVAPFLWTFRT